MFTNVSDTTGQSRSGQTASRNFGKHLRRCCLPHCAHRDTHATPTMCFWTPYPRTAYGGVYAAYPTGSNRGSRNGGKWLARRSAAIVYLPGGKRPGTPPSHEEHQLLLLGHLKAHPSLPSQSSARWIPRESHVSHFFTLLCNREKKKV